MADYVKSNQTMFNLQPGLHVEKPYTFVSRQEMNRLRGNNGETFWRTYPTSGGIRTFSAVGFDSNKTFALVYESSVVPLLGGEGAGSGGILVLQKVDGKWKDLPRKMMCRWIS